VASFTFSFSSSVRSGMACFIIKLTECRIRFSRLCIHLRGQTLIFYPHGYGANGALLTR
jgi:hypothetical protein